MCTDVRSTEILGKIACKSTVQMKNDDIGTPVAISIKSAREVHSLWNPICSVDDTQYLYLNSMKKVVYSCNVYSP